MIEPRMLVATILAVMWILCGITAAVIASSRNRDVMGWFMLGCLLGVFALIMVVALPALPVAPYEPPPKLLPTSGWEYAVAVIGLLVALTVVIALTQSLGLRVGTAYVGVQEPAYGKCRLEYQTALSPAAGSLPPARSWIGATEQAGRVRLDSIDLLRGLVMVLMVLDHTRDFFAAGSFNPRDVNEPALFLTRWITHFCAPVFVFLAGASAFLYGARGRTVGEVSRFLFTRGLMLVLLEVTIVRFAWTFSVFPDLVMLQVIWAIGVSMIAVAGLIHLPRWAIGAIGIGMITGHNLLDGIQAEQLGQLGWLWHVLHQPAFLHPTTDVAVFALYPLIPWVGVMAAGHALGPVMLLEPASRRRWLVGLGVGVTLGFVLLRAANVYGDPAPWARHDDLGATLLSFINNEKYPPSALYLAMTLGPALVALAAFESARGKAARFFVTFGRVPLFYYVAHLLLVHAMAVVFAAAIHGDVAWLFGGLPIEAKSEDYGLGLPGVYLVWVLVVALLYLPCRWFAEVKRRRSERWLSYL